MSALEDLAFEQAVRSIEHQRDAMGSVRERVGSLIAAASIATSFLGAVALEGPRGLNGWAVAAMILFVLSIAGSIYVLWARTGWEFDLDAKAILEEGNGAEIGDVRRELAGWMEDHYANNASRLDRLILAFNLAALALGLEVATWLGAILGGG